MSNEFWIGIIVSIPIGILTGLVVPWIQKVFELKSKSRQVKYKQQTLKQYETVKLYYENKHEFTIYLLSVVIKTTFIAAFVGIFVGALYTAEEVLHSLEIIVYTSAQFLSLVGSILVVNLCRPAIKIYHKVKDFVNYEKELKEKGIIN